jgi:spore coat polysaccharide biosynthesis protein SpsF (cytidylyltransferase family)
MTKTVAIIQARLGSTRLPRKVLADIVGRPLLFHVIERARQIQGVDDMVLATTHLEDDLELVNWARDWDVPCYAGSPEDVLDRYYQAAKFYNADIVMRITADCPFLDPEVSGRVLQRFLQGGVDYVSNTIFPTFPDGLDTEVFSFVALEKSWREAKLISEREHVTPYIWKHPQFFRLYNVQNDTDLSRYRWTVDEAADLEFARAVFQKIGSDRLHMYDVLNVLQLHPSLLEVNRGFTRNSGYEICVQADSEKIK